MLNHYASRYSDHIFTTLPLLILIKLGSYFRIVYLRNVSENPTLYSSGDSK